MYRQILIVLFSVIFSTSVFASDTDIIITTDFLKEIYEDDDLISAEKELLEFRKAGDVRGEVRTYLKLGGLYCNRVNYHKAYESYWEALFLLDKENYPMLKAKVYRGMGILYSLFERNDLAVKYYKQALSINRRLVENEVIPSENLRPNYHSLMVHYRYEGDAENTQLYYDSCTTIPMEDNISRILLESEETFLSLLKGELIETGKSFKTLMPQLEGLEDNQSYLVIFYSSYGDYFFKIQYYKEAIDYYKKALKVAKQERAHLNFTPLLYEKLVEAYKMIGDYQSALKFATVGNNLNQWLYSSKSERNRSLLEISDEYKKREQAQHLEIERQELENYKQEQKILWLTVALLFLIILGVFFMVRTRLKTLKLKYALEKEAIEQKQKLHEEKNQEILYVKNSELTNTTLQIIAKDELLTSIKGKLKDVYKETKSKEVQKVMNAIKLNQDHSWLEFENRFTSVNPSFFSQLKEKHPSLTNYDLKICALIKLNFSGKEMARLLGISPESANTSRYRLRKRLGLVKGEDLVNYLGSVLTTQ
ncbi:tetratricopeptide repeat protein [Flammeovirga sp. EKP202]|uniref:tetratricopeptide repeat protein n=1 Tax=Flammeovirga sp. EKP202 TaxID=2770592 RepID=UPI00165EC481|nr:tetratricopeptide repeat protein [Flammeovirga sp. EKP202]MBD0403750.1 tetratricopeptide repeat protein [Flammeovirga sp. EKP202]